jgi:hypothetical protein
VKVNDKGKTQGGFDCALRAPLTMTVRQDGENAECGMMNAE